MNKSLVFIAGCLWMTTVASALHAAEGDPARGEVAFRQCAACHALQPGLHLTGPSLAGVVGRKAASAQSFRRYSPALQRSGLTWDPATLDRWLADPQRLVPDTAMRIRGIDDAGMRADLIAFLASLPAQDGDTAAGSVMDERMLDLKALTPQQRVMHIRYCGDGYHVTLGTGNTYIFWEFNLRFKTDSSAAGPKAGAPAIVRAGMRGDRAQVVFARPEEISAFIEFRCEE